MSIFATSVIAGLVYAIIMTGKLGVRPRENPKKFDVKYPERRFMGLCIGIGLVLGAGLGVAMDNIGTGIGVGFILGVGVAMDYTMEAKAKKEGKNRSSKQIQTDKNWETGDRK